MTKVPPKKKRIRNPVQTRAKLLQATIDLVAEKGADALSLKEAAIRANVSRGVAYLHFDDRDQLLKEARSWIAERLHDGAKLFDATAPIHDRIVYTTRLVLEHPEASKLMISAALAGQDLDLQHPLYKLVTKMLKERRALGSLRDDVDLEILTYIMFGSIASTLMLGAQHPGGDMNKLAERYTREWGRILNEGIFLDDGKPGAKPAQKKRTTKKPA